jgi:hypothetical protein
MPVQGRTPAPLGAPLEHCHRIIALTTHLKSAPAVNRPKSIEPRRLICCIAHCLRRSGQCGRRGRARS